MPSSFPLSEKSHNWHVTEKCDAELSSDHRQNDFCHRMVWSAGWCKGAPIDDDGFTNRGSQQFMEVKHDLCTRQPSRLLRGSFGGNSRFYRELSILPPISPSFSMVSVAGVDSSVQNVWKRQKCSSIKSWNDKNAPPHLALEGTVAITGDLIKRRGHST